MQETLQQRIEQVMATQGLSPAHGNGVDSVAYARCPTRNRGGGIGVVPEPYGSLDDLLIGTAIEHHARRVQGTHLCATAGCLLTTLRSREVQG